MVSDYELHWLEIGRDALKQTDAALEVIEQIIRRHHEDEEQAVKDRANRSG
jgi:hypothetical protein